MGNSNMREGQSHDREYAVNMDHTDFSKRKGLAQTILSLWRISNFIRTDHPTPLPRLLA
jgi:hypothetical protein